MEAKFGISQKGINAYERIPQIIELWSKKQGLQCLTKASGKCSLHRKNFRKIDSCCFGYYEVSTTCSIRRRKSLSSSKRKETSLFFAKQAKEVEFCFKHVNLERNMRHPMMNVVHIEEWWIFTTKTTRKYYLVFCKNESHRTTKSMRFSTTVMFLASVARLRWDMA